MEPHSLVGGTGESGSVRLGPGLRPLKPTPHGPPTGSGGREKWFVDGRRKRETEKVTLRLFPKGIHPRPQPAQPVGGPLRAFRWEGRRPGTKTEVQPPPPQPHQRRGSRGRNLLPRGFFPPFLPKKWGPGWASQGSLPFQRRRKKPATRPARESPVPTAPEKTRTPRPKTTPNRTTGLVPAPQRKPHSHGPRPPAVVSYTAENTKEAIPWRSVRSSERNGPPRG